MFIIEDTNHAWRSRHFASLSDAIKELQRLARVPWNEEPNWAPCKQWRTRGPLYQLLEVEYGPPRLKLIRSIEVLRINANEVTWLADPSVGIWGRPFDERNEAPPAG